MDFRKILLLSLALIALSGLVAALPLPASGTTLDVNIQTINDFNADSGGNYIGSAPTYVDINFNIRDGDYNGTFDINFDIYLAAFSGDRNFAIATDLNADQYCGGATYNGNGMLIDYNSIDGAACGYRWTTMSSFRDGNWFIDINAVIGWSLLNDTNDVDFNTSGASFYLDRTTATPSISSPAGGYQSGGVPIVMTYTANDVNSGVRKYWIMLNSVVYADNARNTSYTFPTLTNYVTIGVLYNDYADNNSSEGNIIVNASPRSGGETCGNGTCTGGETAATCPYDCAAVCGDGACTGAESKSTCPADCGPGVACGDGICSTGETSGNCAVDCGPSTGQEVREAIRSDTSQGKPTSEDIISILTAAGAGQNAIEKASEAVGKTSVQRNLQVEKITSKGKSSYESKLSIKVTNTSGKKLANVKVIESIPKSVAKKASEISSAYQFSVLKDDPIIEFSVEDLQTNETKEVSYTVKSNVSQASFDEYAQPVVSDATEVEEAVDACIGVNCDDGNQCTADRCSNGTCSNIPVVDGTACGLGQVCQAGSCVTEQARQPTAPTPQQGIDATTIGIIVVVVIVIGAGYYYFKGK